MEGANFRNVDDVCGFDFRFGGHNSLRLTSTSGWEAGVRTDLEHGPSEFLYPQSPANQMFVILAFLLSPCPPLSCSLLQCPHHQLRQHYPKPV